MSAVPFTIINGDTYALCNLDFDTNLRKIDYAEVAQMILIALTSNFNYILFTKSKILSMLPKSKTV